MADGFAADRRNPADILIDLAPPPVRLGRAADARAPARPARAQCREQEAADGSVDVPADAPLPLFSWSTSPRAGRTHRQAPHGAMVRGRPAPAPRPGHGAVPAACGAPPAERAVATTVAHTGLRRQDLAKGTLHRVAPGRKRVDRRSPGIRSSDQCLGRSGARRREERHGRSRRTHQAVRAESAGPANDRAGTPDRRRSAPPCPGAGTGAEAARSPLSPAPYTGGGPASAEPTAPAANRTSAWR